jgi:hypothetical protein
MNWHLFPLFALASFLVTGLHGLWRDGTKPVAPNAAVVSLRAGTRDCHTVLRCAALVQNKHPFSEWCVATVHDLWWPSAFPCTALGIEQMGCMVGDTKGG